MRTKIKRLNKGFLQRIGIDTPKAANVRLKAANKAAGVSEASLHHQVCRYLKIQYPKLIFFSDASGVRLSIGQARKLKALRSGRALPDLFIAEPRNGYNGLFLELKKAGTRIYLKDLKTLVADKHIREQQAMLERLKEKGYCAGFVVGFEQCKSVIDQYLNINN